MYKSISIIYVYYNTPNELLLSIRSLRSAFPRGKFEIIIVDNDSPKPLPSTLKKNRSIKILKNSKNSGFGSAANLGAKIAKGKLLFFLNPDTICLKNSIQILVNKFDENEELGILGPQLINEKGKILHSIGSMPKLPDALFVFSPINKLWANNPYSKTFWGKGLDRNVEQETATVGGAAMMIPKKVFNEARGFDERFFMYFEEADICLRVHMLGYKILYYPKAKIIHLVGKSNSDKIWIRKVFEKSRFEFFKKYYPLPVALFSEGLIRFISLF